MIGPASYSDPSIRAEIGGWLLFLLFLAAVYRLRQVLDRAAGGER